MLLLSSATFFFKENLQNLLFAKSTIRNKNIFNFHFQCFEWQQKARILRQISMLHFVFNMKLCWNFKAFIVKQKHKKRRRLKNNYFIRPIIVKHFFYFLFYNVKNSSENFLGNILEVLIYPLYFFVPLYIFNVNTVAYLCIFWLGWLKITLFFMQLHLLLRKKYSNFLPNTQ